MLKFGCYLYDSSSSWIWIRSYAAVFQCSFSTIYIECSSKDQTHSPYLQREWVFHSPARQLSETRRFSILWSSQYIDGYSPQLFLITATGGGKIIYCDGGASERDCSKPLSQNDIDFLQQNNTIYCITVLANVTSWRQHSCFSFKSESVSSFERFYRAALTPFKIPRNFIREAFGVLNILPKCCIVHRHVF